MSCKGIYGSNSEDRGRIEGELENSTESFAAGIFNCTKLTELSQCDINQSICKTYGDGENVFCESSGIPVHDTTVAKDIDDAGITEEMLKEKKSGNNINIDSEMKPDIIHQNYLLGIDQSFIPTRDTVDMCIVTNMCDMGLGLELPLNKTDRSKVKLNDLGIFICSNENHSILPDYPSDEDPMLNDLTRSGLLDKMENTDASSISGIQKQCDPTNFVLETNAETFSLVSDTAALSKDGKENNWHRGELSHSSAGSSLDREAKEKSGWESIISNSRRTEIIEVEKELDFPEFNLLSFPIDTPESMCSAVNIEHSNESSTQVSDPLGEDEERNVFATSIIGTNNKTVPGLTKLCIQDPHEDLKATEDQVKLVSNSFSVTPKALADKVQKNHTHPASNPRSLLKSPVKCLIANKTSESNASGNTSDGSTSAQLLEQDGLTSNADENLKTKECGLKKGIPRPMTFVAISTDKSKNTTEIVINTVDGEQVFKGKTTDLMKATSNLLLKFDGSKVNAEKQQAATLNGGDNTVDHMLEQDGLRAGSDEEAVTDDLMAVGEYAGTAAEEQPMTEALAELGITLDNVYCFTTVSGKRVWMCPVKGCGRLFPRQSMLKVHILSHFGVRPFKCNFTGCHWSFYTYFKLKRHNETHLKKKDFVCPVSACGRRFTTVYNLNTHRKLHSRPAENSCPVDGCTARFQTRRTLELHLKDHGPTYAPYRCTHAGCNKVYYSANSLNLHIRSHQHKEEELRCQWEGCGKLFDKPCRLKAHMRTHTGDRPYPCTFQDCGWAFSSASKLKRHQYKHTNERRFRCVVEGCGKSFMRSEHLKEHSFTHVSERSFHCPVENCQMKFSAKSSLCVHLKKHYHKTNIPRVEKVEYRCPIEQCNRTYWCKSSLRQHMLRLHTPVLASDASQLDYIALLPGDDAMSTVEGLQFTGEVAQVSSGSGSINTVSLVPSTTDRTSGTDSIVSAQELAGGGFQLQGVLPSNIGGGGVVTHVLLAPNEMPEQQPSLPTAGIEAEQLANPAPEPADSPDCSYGSARTSCTYQDYRRGRDPLRSSLAEPLFGLHTPADVVLGSAHDISQNFLLQDDLGHNQSLYQDDHLMTVGSGVSEFQVLLLDPGGSSRHEFAESTINLQDLE